MTTPYCADPWPKGEKQVNAVVTDAWSPWTMDTEETLACDHMLIVLMWHSESRQVNLETNKRYSFMRRA